MLLTLLIASFVAECVALVYGCLVLLLFLGVCVVVVCFCWFGVGVCLLDLQIW